MTNLATKNGSLIVKDGKLQTDCGCCGGWYCYQGCRINTCCPGDGGFWENCQGQAPTVSAFGVTFTLTVFDARYGWSGGLILQTGPSGEKYVLNSFQLYRHDVQGALLNPFVGLSTCRFKYRTAFVGGGNVVLHYLPSATTSNFGTGTNLVRYASFDYWLYYIAGNQNIVYSPEYSSVGGNSWEINDVPILRPNGTPTGDTTTFYFSDGNQVLP